MFSARAQIYDGDSICVWIQIPVHPHNRRTSPKTIRVGSFLFCLQEALTGFWFM